VALNHGKIIFYLVVIAIISACIVFFGNYFFILFTLLFPGLSAGKGVSGNGSTAKQVDTGLQNSSSLADGLAKDERGTEATERTTEDAIQDGLGKQDSGLARQTGEIATASGAIADGLSVLREIADGNVSK
jgi:hypothetical protein